MLYYRGSASIDGECFLIIFVSSTTV